MIGFAKKKPKDNQVISNGSLVQKQITAPTKDWENQSTKSFERYRTPLDVGYKVVG